MTAPTVSFAAYARAMELGESIPDTITALVGLDPTPYQVLQHLVPRAERRAKGTYFTSSSTASRLWAGVVSSLREDSVIVDPACGAGDLLYPVVDETAQDPKRAFTIRACDIDGDFTRVATAELRRRIGPKKIRLEGHVRDFLTDPSSILDASHVVLNPPFVSVIVDEPWASGKVNAAALFVVRAMQNMKSGSRLLAVLPDVLRSGTRYSAWREHVQSMGSLNRVETHDVFDDKTDVHVFILDLTIGAHASTVKWNQTVTGETLKDFAEVRVGPVVPHRDPEVGPLVPFITARSLSSQNSLARQYAGRLETGPFILVNRTSRPGEVPRVRARLWESEDAVAVENHLIVVAPRDRVSCSEIYAVLTSKSTELFLEDRIRCRHLTVSAMKEIPWQI